VSWAFPSYRLYTVFRALWYLAVLSKCRSGAGSSRLTALSTINSADEGQIIFDVGEQFEWKSGNGNKEILRNVEIRMCTKSVD
jgi:hypothetical protein